MFDLNLGISNLDKVTKMAQPCRQGVPTRKRSRALSKTKVDFSLYAVLSAVLFREFVE